MKKLLLLLLFVPLVSFGQEKNDNYIIEGSIFKVSYNEQYEQPNWIEYTVRNIEKNFDRKGLNFYKSIRMNLWEYFSIRYMVLHQIGMTSLDDASMVEKKGADWVFVCKQCLLSAQNIFY